MAERLWGVFEEQQSRLGLLLQRPAEGQEDLRPLEELELELFWTAVLDQLDAALANL